ncbi:MAG: 5'-nucleotidase C-terminal domain-containing protein [Clostridia bacterium]|nr:5'-nucleotidase C-terminal domain-containing protein [Clostridia bacterium]MDY6184949.1 5'-nucleotidase C-terminal domain-containing protein [Eubacteriales bacterium]
MKRTCPRLLSAILILLALVLCLASCELTFEGGTPSGGTQSVKLATPQVTVTGGGIATWNAVEHAVGYVYLIGDEAEQETTARSVTLNAGESIRVKAKGNGNYLDSDYSAAVTYSPDEGTPDEETRVLPLPTPVITLGNDGVASWEAISGAVGYRYVLNQGEAETTSLTSLQLSDGDTLKVQAIGDGATATDSAYSRLVTYTEGACNHIDADDNGICDNCTQNVCVNIDFYGINDLHGKYMDTNTQPGVDEFTTYMKNLYADASAYEVLFSAGDMWQGTVESSTNRGALMTEWMNEVGFASMTLGNHEFDWGQSGIAKVSTIADFPLLAINIQYNGEMLEGCQASVVVERGGVKIGIIGAIGNCLSSISGEYQTGMTFITGSALTALVKAEATRLREEEDCDFIVYSLHDGYGSSTSGITSLSGSAFSDGSSIYYDTSLSNGYVDLVFEGHTHQSYILKDEYGVYHLQGGGENRAISLARVSYNLVTGSYNVEPRSVSNTVYGNSSIPHDPSVQNIFNKYFPDENPYETVLGTLSSGKSSDEITEKIAELYLAFGKEQWSTYNVVLGGGYLKTRSPYSLNAGNVTYADIFSLLPFDNTLVLGSISGADLKSKFINSTNSAYHSAYDSSLSIVDSSTYYIVVDSYTSSYAPNRITEIARFSDDTFARDLLANFIRGGGWGSTGSGGTGGTGGVQLPAGAVMTSIPDATAVGEALADNGTSTESYYVTGTVVSIRSTTYGNMYIEDTDGNQLYIYGCYDMDGTRYDAMTNPPQVGDTVILYGQIKRYVSTSGTVTIEMVYAKVYTGES